MPTLPKAVTFFAALAPQRVDVENGRIEGLCLMQTGPALGHGTSVDGTTLDQLVTACKALPGAKSHLVVIHDGHPLEVAGDLTNFRRDGNTARADLDVYKNFPSRAQFLEIADRNPAAIGVSAEFKRTDETIGNTKFARVHAVRRFALERDPAAAPNGLFAEGTETNSSLIMDDNDKKTIADIVAAALKPVAEEVTTLKTQFAAVPKPLDEKTQKERDDKLVLDGLTQFAAKVGIKDPPKQNADGTEGTDPAYLTKFKAHKAASPNLGLAITRFAHDNPTEYTAWLKAGSPQ